MLSYRTRVARSLGLQLHSTAVCIHHTWEIPHVRTGYNDHHNLVLLVDLLNGSFPTTTTRNRSRGQPVKQPCAVARSFSVARLQSIHSVRHTIFRTSTLACTSSLRTAEVAQHWSLDVCVGFCVDQDLLCMDHLTPIYVAERRAGAPAGEYKFMNCSCVRADQSSPVFPVLPSIICNSRCGRGGVAVSKL